MVSEESMTIGWSGIQPSLPLALVHAVEHRVPLGITLARRLRHQVRQSHVGPESDVVFVAVAHPAFPRAVPFVAARLRIARWRNEPCYFLAVLGDRDGVAFGDLLQQ